jgi:molybdate transport system ATP-binding protein
MMMWKTDFSDALWTLEEGQQWVISGPVASGKTWITTRLARRYADAVALVTFADQTRSAGSAWAEARWHGSIEYEFRTVDSTLTYEAIHCVSPFEVRPPELEERAAFQALREWLEEALQLKPLLDAWTVHLSNGEQRRLLLARAILRQTPVLVLDDPYAGLDEAMRDCLTETLATLVKQGKTLVLTVRNEDEIPAFITHRLVLKDRRIESQGPYQPPTVEATRLTFGKNPPSLNTPCVLAIRNLTHRPGGGKQLFHGLDWEVHQGERWLITGENGAGKTTLFSLIAGDNPFAYACDIERFGQRLGPGTPLWQIRSQIASVSPEAQTVADPTQTVEAAVFSGIFDKQGSRLSPTHAQRQFAHRLLTTLGLYECLHHTLGALSTGLVRLVLIVRALVAAPKLLLLDEPCLNLEPAERKKLLRLISRLLDELPELTVLCIAHRPEHIPEGFNRHLHLTAKA